MSETPERNRVARVAVSAVWVVALAVLAKILGVGKDIVVAARFGTSSTMDAWLVAATVPMLIGNWFRSPIRSGFVPLFTERLENEGEEAAWRAGGTFLGNFLVMTSLIAIVVWIWASAIISGIAPGFGEESHALAVNLVRILTVSIALAAVTGTFRNLNHVYGNFVLPGLPRLVTNFITMVAVIVLSARFGIHVLAYAWVLGSITSVLIQSPTVLRHRKHMRIRVDLRDPLFWGVMKLGLPLFIGMAGAKLDEVIDRVFASMLSAGSISGLSYALRLIDLPKEILVAGFWTVLFPFYSRLAARGQTELLADRLNASMRIVFFMLFPISIAMAMLAEPFVSIIFQRGAFDEQSVDYTVAALLLYTPTIWALGLTTTMISAFVAMKDTKTPVIAGLIRLGVKVALVFAFIGPFQHAGVALSTSLSHVFKLALFLIWLPPVLKKGKLRTLFRAFGGTVAATAVMAVTLFFLGRVVLRMSIPPSLPARVAVLGGTTLVGLGVYIGAARVFARPELTEMWDTIRSGVGDILKKVKRRPRKES